MTRIGFAAVSDLFLPLDSLKRARPNWELSYFAVHPAHENHPDLERFAADLDLLFFDVATIPLVRASRSLRCPIVVRHHRSDLRENFLGKVDWSRVREVIFVAEHLREDRPCRTSVIPIFVDPDLFRFAGRSFEPPHRIAMVGRVAPSKGILSAIQCLPDLPREAELDIVGWEDLAVMREYKAQCLEWIATLGLEGRVRFHGAVSRARLAALLGECALAINYSVAEGAPISIVEAMMTGCRPLVARWKGADRLYAAGHLFSSPGELVLRFGEWLGSDRRAGSLACRERAIAGWGREAALLPLLDCLERALS